VLSTGNNPITPATFRGQYLSNDWDMPWRVQLIYRELTRRAADHKLSAEDVRQMQTRTATLVGQSIAADLYAAASRAGVSEPAQRAALAGVRGWDGDAAAASRGAAIYETWLALFTRDLIAPLTGDAYGTYAQSIFITTQELAAWQQLERPLPIVFNTTTAAAAGRARDRLAARALAETVNLLSTSLGADADGWTWGRLHTLTYNHPLAGLEARYAICPGPVQSTQTSCAFAVGGDAASVAIGGWFASIGVLALPDDQLDAAGGVQAAYAMDSLQVARVTWDLGDPDGSYGILSTGESGSPGSPHYADMAQLWRTEGTHRLPFTADAVLQAGEASWRLIPA
jgi:penicillin amidase